LTQCKQQLEKIYASRENLDDSMSIQRHSYDKTGLGYLFNMSTKKPEIRSIYFCQDMSLHWLHHRGMMRNPIIG
ncbi:hypothetical protein P3S38_29530, partial [Enterobacter hormaechei]|uniref:hypothetical protein n=1 Tax=Enterobacter hormaechei TaxID=158836 RepID=UPI0023E448A5